ncbi:N-(5'-phosphoribosyl)anthranilate isomerase [uncultured Clostridium sp.]|nr:n-(5'-phosphoribosyl)anthranilate isomerase [Firmicutes bacterium CAG:212]SCH32038.1 N-(5'-phosphoribosyl)anthranilate isomerase [uncultured Clostridium sp.]
MKIKLCGLKRIEDIEAVNEEKPDYIGFIFAKKSRRYVSTETAERLKQHLNPDIEAVGVFVNEDIDKVIEQAKKQVIDVIQLHGEEDVAYVKDLKKAVDVLIIKAISMTKPDARQQINMWEISDVDYLLLDSGNGGTGEQFSYKLLQEIGNLKKPYFLAGGLNPENLENAVQQQQNNQPYALDLSSGIETNGIKDLDKIKKAVEAARRI